MSPRKKNENSEKREAILKAARSLFAKDGFDGASVDDIAKKASVNKALIYYYFKSKKGLIEAIIDTLIEDTIAEKMKRYELAKENGGINFKETARATLEFMKAHKETFTILHAEMVTGKSGNYIYNYIDKTYDQLSHLLKEGAKKKYQTEVLMPSFFLIMLPLIAYTTFGDVWRKKYGLKEKDADEEFIRQYEYIFRGFWGVNSEKMYSYLPDDVAAAIKIKGDGFGS